MKKLQTICGILILLTAIGIWTGDIVLNKALTGFYVFGAGLMMIGNALEKTR